MEKIQDKFGRFRAFIGSKSQSKPKTEASARATKIRDKAGRFRVLIIGRANAGKTTILQKVCNTVEQPEIFDSKGNKIDTSLVAPTVLRGMHDINNELVFQSNSGFIFHDSRGFEAGGVAELDTVKDFISERSKMGSLSDQLHVIWYCIPMDDERPFTAAEKSFFSECGTGSVPVVVIFTKFDALEDVAYGELKNEGVSREDAIMQTAARAVFNFERMYLPQLDQWKYPPKGHVYLRDMDKAETDCRELTETVAAVLDDDNLQQLFVSTQRINLGLCMDYAVKWELTPAITNVHQITETIPTEFQERMAKWYPHFYPIFAARFLARTDFSAELIPNNAISMPIIQSAMSPLIGSPPATHQMARFGVALAIIAEHSFYLWDRAPSKEMDPLISAINTYQSSDKHTAVTQAVDDVFGEGGGHLFEEAKNRHYWDEKNSTFAKRLARIATDNRLPLPQST